MNFLDIPEYAGPSTPHKFRVADLESRRPAAEAPLTRLAGGMGRRARVPPGYRFIANISAADLKRALRALRYGSDASELLLKASARDERGAAAPGFALYVRAHLPDPQVFWLLFHALGERSAA